MSKTYKFIVTLVKNCISSRLNEYLRYFIQELYLFNLIILTALFMTEVGLDAEIIYNYNTHRNIPWNILQYQPLREYLDPKQILENKRLKRGGSQVKRYVTKRGSFIDQHIKVVKDLPASCTYNFLSEFDQTLNLKESRKHKIDFKLRKNSYLQQIESKAKRFKSPGVGQYKLESQQKNEKSNKHQDKGQKIFFYQDSEYLSTTVPGSGAYNPHDVIPNTKKQRNDHKYWIKKHSQEKQKYRKRNLKSSGPGTYRPLSISFSTFDRVKIQNQKNKKKAGKNKPTHGFGSSDTKFDYQRAKKSQIDLRPDPCNYNTMIQWKGKGSNPKKNNWIRCLSAGPSKSVYY